MLVFNRNLVQRRYFQLKNEPKTTHVMSLICVYPFVKTIVFSNKRIQLVFELNTTCIKIRALWC
jgi:hypothetical protein